jgi:hypothetical protein
MTIPDRHFEKVILMKIQKLLLIIITRENIEFLPALKYLYDSRVYNALSDQKSGVWALTPNKLYELLTYEKTKQRFRFHDNL